MIDFDGEEGTVTLEAETSFRAPVYRREDDEMEDETTVRDDYLSPHIWWFRK